jgi:hypothetical protein
MPNFGYDVIGTATINFNAPGSLGMGHADRVFSPTSGYNRVKNLYIYGKGTSIRMAVYTVAAQLPVDRVAASVAIPLTGALQWNSSAYPLTLTNGKTYGVAEGAAVNADVYRELLAGNQRSHDATDLPATWTSDGVSSNAYSMYAEYETVREYCL